MDEERREERGIVLLDRDLVKIEKPQRERKYYVKLRGLWEDNGETNLKEYKEMDVVDEFLSDYRVHASAVKYLADVARINRERPILHGWEEPIERETEEVILFEGNITFYKKGKLPDEGFEGRYFVRSGEIYTARSPTEVFAGFQGLKELIFEGADTKPQKVERVEALIRGYEDLEFERSRARQKRRHDAYMGGLGDGMESSHGTFGR